MTPLQRTPACCAGLLTVVVMAGMAAAEDSHAWVDRILNVPYEPVAEPTPPPDPMLEVLRQDAEELQINRSVICTPLAIGGRKFDRGLGTHSIGHIRIRSPRPMAGFSASIGVDNNERTEARRGSVTFAVSADGKPVFSSKVMRGGDEAETVDLRLEKATVLDLRVGDAGDGIGWDHADWAEAKIVTADGKTYWLDRIPRGPARRLSRYPFSFSYNGVHCDELLVKWTRQVRSDRIDKDRVRTVTVWTDPKTGLKLEWQVTRFDDFPAVEWLLYFENGGAEETPIIEDVQALDLALDESLDGDACYRLHRTNGAPSNPTDFEPRVVPLAKGASEVLGGGGGRSSNRDFPFLKIETARAS